MIKLGRLSVENFKSFEGLYEIDFRSTDLFILDGPNGFGKTTVFDAIELCITGEIGRLINTDNKQKSTHLLKYDLNKPTNVFLELVCNQETILVIHALIPKETTQDSNKPKNCKADVKFLKIWPEDNADLLNLNYIDDVSLEGVLKNNNIKDTFDIFNYIQQEETFHFLKTKENERHDKISYLFGTSNQTNDKQILNKVKNQLSDLLKEQDEEISKLEDENKILESALTSDFNSGLEEGIKPSGKINLDLNLDINDHLKNINELVWILNNSDTFKKIKFDHDINYILLNRRKQISDIIKSGHIRNYDKVYKIERHIRWIEELATKIEKHKEIIKSNTDSIELNIIDAFSKQFPRVALQYKSRIDSYKVLKSKISGFQDIVAKIINSRNNLKNHYEMHLSFENTTSKCPFCGNYKSSISDLWIAYDEQTIFFDGLKDEALEELNIIIDSLNDGFIKECKSKSIYFIEKYERFTDLLPALGEQLISKDDWLSMDKLRLWFESSNVDVAQFTKLDSYNFIGGNLPVKVNSFILYLKSLISLSVANKSYSDYFHIINNYNISESNGVLINNSGNNIDVLDLNKDINFLKFENLKSKSSALKENSRKIFELKAKKLIINEKFELVRSMFNKYNSAIKKYELNVAKQIAIPFHIYSSKILQTRPDGNGAYLQSAENLRESGYIRFVSNLTHEHDAWNTMSSGQLSGIILSFTLAMNKVYPTKFGTLLIDDPVQTMDEINLASFVQLLRNEFLNYQVVISTHERQTSNYFSYKYQNGNMVKVLNLKKERLVG
ncbi:AAA family ATPase [Acinetobacter dispersus]|uniref:AAA family ATPase n=1 Tax=Acinetobacter dispersus TaxID=70348 RepID=UPI001F4B3C18|nr:AAA family ATPase [Acinetobacter dispersus]MCH7391474.1 AAA family ATPase [Acinetobacter dispersus]